MTTDTVADPEILKRGRRRNTMLSASSSFIANTHDEL